MYWWEVESNNFGREYWWEVESNNFGKEHRWEDVSVQFWEGILVGGRGTLVGGGIKQFWEGNIGGMM